MPQFISAARRLDIRRGAGRSFNHRCFIHQLLIRSRISRMCWHERPPYFSTGGLGGGSLGGGWGGFFLFGGGVFFGGVAQEPNISGISNRRPAGRRFPRPSISVSTTVMILPSRTRATNFYLDRANGIPSCNAAGKCNGHWPQTAKGG